MRHALYQEGFTWRYIRVTFQDDAATPFEYYFCRHSETIVSIFSAPPSISSLRGIFDVFFATFLLSFSLRCIFCISFSRVAIDEPPWLPASLHIFFVFAASSIRCFLRHWCIFERFRSASFAFRAFRWRLSDTFFSSLWADAVQLSSSLSDTFFSVFSQIFLLSHFSFSAQALSEGCFAAPFQKICLPRHFSSSLRRHFFELSSLYISFIFRHLFSRYWGQLSLAFDYSWLLSSIVHYCRWLYFSQLSHIFSCISHTYRLFSSH